MYACLYNAVRTILPLTLVTHGHLLRVRLGTTKGTYIPIITHNILIIIVLLCRCGPYMCRYMLAWTIWRVPYLSSNQKLLQMQEYKDLLMQRCTGYKQVLNSCPIETMHIVVFRLSLGQSLSTDKGPYHMEAPRVCTIRGANLIIHIMSVYPFGPLTIPNENIRRCPGASGQIQTMLPTLSMATVALYNQKSKRTLGATMMPLVSQSMGL